MDFIFEFLEGKLNYRTFIEKLYYDDRAFEWLQSLFSKRMISDKSFWCHNSLDRNNGSVKACIDSRIGKDVISMVTVYDFIYHYIEYAIPAKKVTATNYYRKMADIYHASVSSYYGGPEVDQLISDLIMNLPVDLTKTQKIKLAKEKIKELFPCVKRPIWIQEPEWPLSSSGKPMRFVEQKRKKGKEYIETLYTMYIFEDVDTGEKRIVEQFT